MGDEPANEAPSTGDKRASKVRDIEALRARIAQAQAQSSSTAGKNSNAWDSMKSGMTKAVKSGGKVESVQKAMAETGASIKSTFAGWKLDEKLKGLLDCGGVMSRLESWKQHSPVVIGVIVLAVFLVVGATFLLTPPHVADVSVDVDLGAAVEEAIAAESPSPAAFQSSYQDEAAFSAPAPSFAWGSSTPLPAPMSRHIDSAASKKEAAKASKEKAAAAAEEEEETKKKLSPKERRAAAREALLMQKVEQHVQDYRSKLVDKLHDKKADPSELLKATSGGDKGGRKEKAGK